MLLAGLVLVYSFGELVFMFLDFQFELLAIHLPLLDIVLKFLVGLMQAVVLDLELDDRLF